MPGRRILITGIASYLGTELARILEADSRVEYVAGLDTRPPGEHLERTQLIVADIRDPEISGLIPPTEVDTVVHNQIVRRPGPGMSARRAHDINVIGSLQLLAACERTPTLRSIVVRGSAGIYGSEPAAPQFFTEEMAHLYPLRTRFQRDVGEIENLFGTYARRHPDVVCTMLRYQHSIGPTVKTEITRYLSLPVVPTYLGFDPRLQLVHERDALANAMAERGLAAPEGDNWPQLVDALLSKHVEPALIEPTFLFDYPVEMSPFAKRHRAEEGICLAQVDRRRAAEAVRAKELAATGNLVRLWRPAGELRSIGLWRAADEAEPHDKVLGTLPLRPWMTPVIAVVESRRATRAGPTPRADRRTCSRARPDMRTTRQGHPSPNPQMKPAGACPAAWTPAVPLYRKEASCPMSPPATKAPFPVTEPWSADECPVASLWLGPGRDEGATRRRRGRRDRGL